MTHLEDDKLPGWHTLCEPIAHCVRVTPCSDTLVSPLEMLGGRQAKHPFVQPVDVTFVRAEVVDRRERQRAYIRARAMLKRDQMENDDPTRGYQRTVQVFQKNDFVRMKVEGSAITLLLEGPTNGLSGGRRRRRS